MNDIYILTSGMTKEQMFRLRLINGFNFALIVADAIVDLSKDFFQNFTFQPPPLNFSLNLVDLVILAFLDGDYFYK